MNVKVIKKKLSKLPLQCVLGNHTYILKKLEYNFERKDSHEYLMKVSCDKCDRVFRIPDSLTNEFERIISNYHNEVPDKKTMTFIKKDINALFEKTNEQNR